MRPDPPLTLAEAERRGLTRIKLACDTCGRRGDYVVSRLRERFADVRLIVIRESVSADCPRLKTNRQFGLPAVAKKTNCRLLLDAIFLLFPAKEAAARCLCPPKALTLDRRACNCYICQCIKRGLRPRQPALTGNGGE